MTESNRRPRRQRSYVYVILLEGNQRLSSKYQDLNPDYIQGKPNVVIESLKVNPSETYAANSFEESSNRLICKYGSEILSEFSTSHTTRWGVVSSIDRITTQLRSQGWAVMNPKPLENRSVYVIELDDTVSELAKVQRLNLDADPSLQCLYVGQTGLEPQQRFERHMRGHQASPYVKRFGLNLNMAFLRRPNPMTELASLREENSLAQHLRSRGHTVVGGH